MNEIFELITKLRHELEACRTGENDTKVMDAIQTVNAVDNKLLKQANGVQAKEATAISPRVMLSCPKCEGTNIMQRSDGVIGCVDCFHSWRHEA
jgi:protein-arginine kinase activator protein McsA